MQFLSTLAVLAVVHLAAAAPTPATEVSTAVQEKRQSPDDGQYIYFRRDEEKRQSPDDGQYIYFKRDEEKRQSPDDGQYIYFRRDGSAEEKRQSPDDGQYIYF
ncbi:hypothetical protein GQ53DRAFT_773719 [Thozetella sp. PMI_491]|nr:hypothetical protein GQ53DRAFT_773719 [Thozetella sp. PMI_491]